MPQPLLKWPGGKRSELPIIAPRIPEYERYFEPFFGGGSVYFNRIDTDAAFANDLHPDLIAFYRAVKVQDDEFFSMLEHWLEEWEKGCVLDKERMYYEVRNRYNRGEASSTEKTACFFLLRELAYGGMFRLNASGYFNVPFGRAYAHSNGLLRRKVNRLHSKAVREKMSRITFHALDFENFLDNFVFGKSDFMFVDPPYDTSFSSYGNQNDFDVEDQNRLRERLHDFSGKFMLVCKLTPLTERLYCNGCSPNFHVNEYDAKYRFNIKGRFSRDARHIMVTNYASHQ